MGHPCSHSKTATSGYLSSQYNYLRIITMNTSFSTQEETRCRIVSCIKFWKGCLYSSSRKGRQNEILFMQKLWVRQFLTPFPEKVVVANPVDCSDRGYKFYSGFSDCYASYTKQGKASRVIREGLIQQVVRTMVLLRVVALKFNGLTLDKPETADATKALSAIKHAGRWTIHLIDFCR